MSALSFVVTTGVAILSGGAAGGIMRGRQEKAADLRSRRIDAAMESLVPLGAARVGLFAATGCCVPGVSSSPRSSGA